jgi:hypothetical protein
MVGNWGVVAGVLVTSLLFGVVHLVPLQALSAAAIGVALHYIFLTTKSLAAPMLLHFLNNLLATLSMRYSDELPIPGLSVVEGTAFFSTPLDVLAVSALLVLALGYAFHLGRTQWQWPDGKPYDFGYVTGETPSSPEVVARRGHVPLAFYCVLIALSLVLLWRLWASIPVAA